MPATLEGDQTFFMLSRITLFLCAFEAAIALLLAGSLIFSGSDPATAGLDDVAGIALILVAAAFIVPAARLAWLGRKPRLALALAIAPVAILACAFVALVLSMA